MSKPQHKKRIGARKCMFRERLTSLPIYLHAFALMVLLGCASCATPRSPLSPATPALVNSPAMGLVGLLVMDPEAGPPRAAGMKGVVVGYVTSHPALHSILLVGRHGHRLPVLAFRMTMVIVRSGGSGGMEDTSGRGELEVFYDPKGFGDALLNDPRTLDGAEEIEADDVEFHGRIDFNTYRFYMRLHETAVASRAFTFDGRKWRTPTSRTAWDVLVGEYSNGFVGVAFASNNTMRPLSPQEKLFALAGPRPGSFRY